MKINALLFIILLMMIKCAKKDSGRELLLLKEKALSSRKAITIVWKNDSTGCEGKRKNMLNNQSIPFDSILGLNTKFIIQYFGKPNYINSTKKRFYYSIDCKYAPPFFNLPDSKEELTKRIINTDAALFYLEFNSDSIIIDKGGMIN